MCGIAGYHGLHADHALLERMNDCQQHRGPDGEGIVTSGPCGLAHRRLSIIDVAHGQQPMDTADGRYSIAYNGEVYNYLDLREELVGLGRDVHDRLRHRGGAPGLRAVGPRRLRPVQRDVRPRIWDREEKRLTLARDHFGIKPVYVARVPAPSGEGEVLLFASEIKPILASGLYDKRVNERSVYRYLRFRAHEDGTETFFDGIERLAPGEMLTADGNGIQRRMFTRLKEELLELRARAAALRRRSGRGVQATARRVGAAAPAVGGAGGHVSLSGRARLQRRRGHHQPAAERGRRAVDPRGRHPAEHLLGGLPRLDQRRGALRRRRPRDLHRPRRLAQDPADGRRVQGRPGRLHPHPGGAAHLLRPVRAVPGDARGHQARHGAARRPGRRRDDGRLHPLLLRLPAPAARPGRHDGRGRARQEPRRALPAGPLQAQGQGHAEEDHPGHPADEPRVRRRPHRRALRLRGRQPQEAARRGPLPQLAAEPAALRGQEHHALLARGARAVPRQGGAEVHLQPVRRGDHQGRLEQAGAARRHPRAAARVDQPPPQQDRVHHPAGRVVHAAEEPLLQHLPQRVVRQPALREPDRGHRRVRGLDQGRQRRRHDDLLAADQPRAVDARVHRRARRGCRRGPRREGRPRQDRLRAQRGSGARPHDHAR